MIPTIAIDASHAADMARKVTVANELGNRGLDGDRAMPVARILRSHERGECPGRRHDESEPQRRKHAFGKRADVKDMAGRGAAAQRFQWTPVVPEFTVVIVLDDDGAFLPRKPEQFLSAARRHRHSKRELMRGADANDLRIGREQMDDDPFAIDGHGTRCAPAAANGTRIGG